MDNLFEIRILAADKKVYTGKTRSLVAPGVEGYLGVLANHAPLVTALKAGVLKVEGDSGESLTFAVSGGVLEVRDNRATVLADAAERSGEIDVERAKDSLERARKRLSGKDPGVDIDRARASLERALNRLRVGGGGTAIR